MKDLQPLAEEMTTWLTMIRETATEEAPAFAQELVMWGLALHLFGVFCVLALGVALAYAMRWCWLRKEESSHADRDNWIFAFVVMIFCAVILFIVLMYNLTNAAMAFFAPKLYVVETLASLIH